MSAPTLPPAMPPAPVRSKRWRKPMRPATVRRPSRPARSIRPGESVEALQLLSSACAVIAIICAWVILQMLVFGNISEARSQHLLYSQFRSELAQETAPMGALDYNNKPVVEGSPVALLSIPTLGIDDMVVVDGTASGDLLNGPGHRRDTPDPGEAGVSMVMGRATTYGAPFKSITSLKPGARIEVISAQGTTTYTVRDVRRAGDPIPPQPTGKSPGRLILATAGSSGFLSALRPSKAVFVDADTSKAFPAGPVFPAVSNAEQLMQRDTTALPLLVLLLAIVAGLVLAVSIARRHIRATLVWLVAAPVAMALAWAVTDQVMRLLPNLM